MEDIKKHKMQILLLCWVRLPGKMINNSQLSLNVIASQDMHSFSGQPPPSPACRGLTPHPHSLLDTEDRKMN